VSAHLRNVGSHAFLILAHKDPELVEVLIEELKLIGNIYLHIDRKPLRDFSKLLSRNDIFATSEVNVKWGHWSQVEATLILINRAMNEGARRLTLISGDSLPLVPQEKFEKMMLDDIDICQNRKLKNSKNLQRDDKYFRRYFGAKNYAGFVPRSINFLFHHWPLKIRMTRYLGPLDLHIGSAYWSVSERTMTTGLKYCNSNPNFLKYFKKVKHSDEIFFQTLIGNFSEKLDGTGIMYANWEGEGTAHPGELDLKQIGQEFASQKFLFARKFSTLNNENFEKWKELRGTKKS
jgi:hypothetical protein